MTPPRKIAVVPAGEQPLNGLAMMILQYMEQNLADSESKNAQALKLRCRTAIEVDKGIGVTVDFQGDSIEVCNHADLSADIELKSSYLLLANVLSGKASPLWEILRGNIQVNRFSASPSQALRVLRFLRLPDEFIRDTMPRRSLKGMMTRRILGIVLLVLVVTMLLNMLP